MSFSLPHRSLLASVLIGAMLASCGYFGKSGKRVRVGAERMDVYIDLLRNKSIGLVINHGSIVGERLLVDTLLDLEIEIAYLFSPEHGLWGKEHAGMKFGSDLHDSGIQIVSLYGESYMPSAEHMEKIDLMVFDIQDVGTRFYTYLSTLNYVMRACSESGTPLLVLDRPNPNGSYFDGPVLEDELHSFVGMNPIPIVHGCTLGELSMMINEEGWLGNDRECALRVIPVENWTHQDGYDLPVRPSPNLRSSLAIRLYPSLCLFEGTMMSVGRGTPSPFTLYGHPEFEGDFRFTPSGPKDSRIKLKDTLCHGISLKRDRSPRRFTLSYLINAYEIMKKKDLPFFNDYFEYLVGNSQLRKQIIDGMNEETIRESWKEGLETYSQIRDRYLIYPKTKSDSSPAK